MEKRIACVYSIVNLHNNKQYIGSTSNLKKRKEAHFYKLRKKIHPNKHLQTSFSKYGNDKFILKVLEHVSSKSLLERREQSYLNYAKNYGILLYNVRTIAKNNTGLFTKTKNPFYGKTHSKRFSLEQSKRMRLKNPQKSGKENSFYSKHHTKEFINYMKERMGGSNHPRFGKRKKYCPKRHLRSDDNLNTSYGCKLCAKIKDRIYRENRKRN